MDLCETIHILNIQFFWNNHQHEICSEILFELSLLLLNSDYCGFVIEKNGTQYFLSYLVNMVRKMLR